jgi:FAD/FMN-containing dehydrogenase
MRPVVNFGGNVRFTPARYYVPRDEAEVLAVLDRHAGGTVRVVGALHSWSPVVVSADAVIDLRHFDRVTVERDPDGAVWATVGGGCRVKHLLRKLRHIANVTLPSLGLITEQTVAGAMSTGTHGSGRHSMSHYAAAVRAAAYDPATGKARVYTWTGGPELRAARCALGCMGVILSVRIRCVPAYDVTETIVPCATLDEVLAGESAFPLQQFFLLPHGWTYLAQRRAVAPVTKPRHGLRTSLYRLYWLYAIDIGLHLNILRLAYLNRPRLTRFFFRHVLSRLTPKNVTVTDRSDRMLVMEHELFRHFEIEAFVPAAELRRAVPVIRAILEVFAGTAAPDPETAAALDTAGVGDDLRRHRGAFTFHYPVAFRKVLADDTLVSPAAGPGEPYYAVSFTTYARPPGPFLALAAVLARALARLFRARLHWGKHFPLAAADVGPMYPGLGEFRALCLRVDPNGVFVNDFARRMLLD